MAAISLMNSVNHIKGEISAVPTNILDAVNKTATILKDTTGNITNTLLNQIQG
jgi:hypothetical protein